METDHYLKNGLWTPVINVFGFPEIWTSANELLPIFEKLCITLDSARLRTDNMRITWRCNYHRNTWNSNGTKQGDLQVNGHRCWLSQCGGKPRWSQCKNLTALTWIWPNLSSFLCNQVFLHTLSNSVQWRSNLQLSW